MRNCFQYPPEGHSETSNDQEAFLSPFHHYIKMKENIKAEWGVGETLYPRVDYLPLPQVNSMFIETRHKNCFQYLLEGLSETSNNQALLIPFIIIIA